MARNNKDSDFLKSALIIGEIKKYPVLYDTSHPSFAERTVKTQCWDGVCAAVFPNWGDMNACEKSVNGKDIQKRWRSIRDSYTKQYRAGKCPPPATLPSGGGRRLQHQRQMAFFYDTLTKKTPRPSIEKRLVELDQTLAVISPANVNQEKGEPKIIDNQIRLPSIDLSKEELKSILYVQAIPAAKKGSPEQEVMERRKRNNVEKLPESDNAKEIEDQVELGKKSKVSNKKEIELRRRGENHKEIEVRQKVQIKKETKPIQTQANKKEKGNNNSNKSASSTPNYSCIHVCTDSDAEVDKIETGKDSNLETPIATQSNKKKESENIHFNKSIFSSEQNLPPVYACTESDVEVDKEKREKLNICTDSNFGLNNMEMEKIICEYSAYHQYEDYEWDELSKETQIEFIRFMKEGAPNPFLPKPKNKKRQEKAVQKRQQKTAQIRKANVKLNTIIKTELDSNNLSLLPKTIQLTPDKAVQQMQEQKTAQMINANEKLNNLARAELDSNNLSLLPNTIQLTPNNAVQQTQQQKTTQMRNPNEIYNQNPSLEIKIGTSTILPEEHFDDDRLFMLSLLPFLRKMDDDARLACRIEVLKVIKRALQLCSRGEEKAGEGAAVNEGCKSSEERDLSRNTSSSSQTSALRMCRKRKPEDSTEQCDQPPLRRRGRPRKQQKEGKEGDMPPARWLMYNAERSSQLREERARRRLMRTEHADKDESDSEDTVYSQGWRYKCRESREQRARKRDETRAHNDDEEELSRATSVTQLRTENFLRMYNLEPTKKPITLLPVDIVIKKESADT